MKTGLVGSRSVGGPFSIALVNSRYSVFRLWHDFALIKGRACLLCPGMSDVNLLGYGKGIVYLDSEVTHRALNFGVSQ